MAIPLYIPGILSINNNPYEGLKQDIWLFQGNKFNLSINNNPYEGLKQEENQKTETSYHSFQLTIIPMRD